MKALTVRQPFCDAIAYGTKRIENRSKPLPAKHIGTRTLLHAGKGAHVSGVTAADFTGEPWPDVRSAILAVVRFTGSHRSMGACCAPWGHQETDERQVWHWELDDHVQRLTEPVPASGALGFWTPDAGVLEAVRAAMRQSVQP